MIRYLTLAEYLWLAEQVTGIDAVVLARTARVDLADSALNAPQAAFGEHEFYPTIRDKAAVLLCRLVRNHPLPDGNKRAGWASLTLFLDLNGYQWRPEPPDVPSTEAVIVSIAAGAVSEDDVARWISQHIRAVDT